MAQGKRTPLDIRRAIEAIAGTRDVSARVIIDELTADPRYRGRVPEERTVQGLMRRQRARHKDPSGPWSLADPETDADDAALVFPVFGELMSLPDSRIRTVTRHEAEWIARLRRAIPDLPAIWALHYARRYIGRGRDDATDIDQELARESWREQPADADPEVIAAGQRYETPADWGVPLHDPERAAEVQAAYHKRKGDR